MDQISCTPITGDMKINNGNPLNFKYFMTLFKELAESNIEGPWKSSADNQIRFRRNKGVNKALY